MNVSKRTLDLMTRAVIVIALALFASFGSVPVAGQLLFDLRHERVVRLPKLVAVSCTLDDRE